MRFTDHLAHFYGETFDIEDIPCTVQWRDDWGEVVELEFHTATFAEKLTRYELVRFFGEDVVSAAEDRIRESIQDNLRDYDISQE